VPDDAGEVPGGAGHVVNVSSISKNRINLLMCPLVRKEWNFAVSRNNKSSPLFYVFVNVFVGLSGLRGNGKLYKFVTTQFVTRLCGASLSASLSQKCDGGNAP
jgi:hypothetical protein